MKENWASTILLTKEIITGIVALPNGELYFTNSEGLWTMQVKNKNAQLLLPRKKLKGLSWDGNKSLYMYDTVEILVYRIDTVSLVTRSFKQRQVWRIYSDAWGLAVDKTNRELYVGHTWGIRRINLVRKSVIADINIPTAFNPISVAYLDGVLYVPDHKLHVIRSVKEGYFDTVCGTCGTDEFQDGTLQEAKFGHPRCVAVDNRTLLVVDDYGLRRIDFDKQKVTTVHQSGVMLCSTSDDKGNIFIGTINGIIMLEKFWKWERFLWIGKLKEESSYCLLALLPKEMIREISAFVRTSVAVCAGTKRKRNSS